MKNSQIKPVNFIKAAGIGTASLIMSGLVSCTGHEEKKPNIIIIFCDDLGYGDLGVFGHPTIQTPNIDNMAMEGQKWTNFYAAASVCTPSRAGLLTGRLPIRNGMCSHKRGVLFPNSAGGLPDEEITIAEAVKSAGYKTACIGKWHLGHLPQYLPVKQGFDYYYGIPYSNDMDQTGKGGKDKFLHPKPEYFNVPLMQNEDIIERPAYQNNITKRYTEESIRFIKENKDDPFFIYLAHNLPHVPLFVSDDFKGKSLRGLFGDVIEEIDFGVGEILKTLKEEGLDRNTMVVFTSDNGPWLSHKKQGGSAGLLRDGKGTTWEGGMREPTVFWWPGKISPGVITDIGSTMDLFSTICKLTGITLPDDRVMDSENLLPVLLGTGACPRNSFFYYRGTTLYAARKGSYKAHFITETSFRGDNNKKYHDPPLLFHLGIDPGENFDVSGDHPEIIQEILEMVEKHKSELVPGEDQLAKRIQKE